MGELRTLLMWPFLPADARLRLRQQRYDAEAANRAPWVLETPDLSVTLITGVEGGTPGRGMSLRPTPPPGIDRAWSNALERRWWYAYGAIEWDGLAVAVVGERIGRDVRWEPTPGGLRPGFDAVEVFEARRRPTTSGECPDRIAAIATVGPKGHHVQRIYFLDEEARDLGWVPGSGFAEEDVMRFAAAAGIAYRRYAFTFAKFSTLRVTPSRLCEVLFVRSARRARLVGEVGESPEGWFTDSPKWW